MPDLIRWTLSRLALGAVLFLLPQPTISSTQLRSNTASVRLSFVVPESQRLSCDVSSCAASFNFVADAPKTVSLSVALVEPDGSVVLPSRMDAFEGVKSICDPDSGCGNTVAAIVAGHETVRVEFKFTTQQLGAGLLSITSTAM